MKRIITAALLAIFMLAVFAACGGGPAEITEPDPETHVTPFTATVIVTLPDGTQNTHTLTSTKSTLGEVLRDYGLIECDDSGYIVAVEGIEASWDNDKAYWAFEINGQYAMHGVDDEVFTDGNTYALKYTKG